jgi:hypothetical protein
MKGTVSGGYGVSPRRRELRAWPVRSGLLRRRGGRFGDGRRPRDCKMDVEPLPRFSISHRWRGPLRHYGDAITKGAPALGCGLCCSSICRIYHRPWLAKGRGALPIRARKCGPNALVRRNRSCQRAAVDAWPVPDASRKCLASALCPRDGKIERSSKIPAFDLHRSEAEPPTQLSWRLSM